MQGQGSSRGVRGMVQDHRLLVFAGIVVLLTLLVAALRLGRETAPFALIFVSPISALITAGVADGRGAIVRIFRRIARWRVAPRWYAIAFGIPLLMWLGVAAGGIATGTPTSSMFQGLVELPLVFLVVLIPAFIEEFGWRGYAVPIAPRSWSMLITALVVGGLFIVPHLALYLPGGLYDTLPLWPLPFILLSYAVLLTWAYVGSGGSALIAALMHGAFNGMTPLSRGIDPVTEWQLHGIVITIIAVAVVALSPALRRAIGERRAAPAGMQITLEPAASSA